MDKILENIINQIKTEQEISPFLFVWHNLEIVNEKTNQIALEILNNFNIPKINLFSLEDNWEKIKIAEIKKFLELNNSTTPYKFQIFLIENYSRITLQASNSCLKIFEEPWIQNIFFLTNKSESGILDTILSRVQTINLWTWKIEQKNEFFYNLIYEWIQKKDYKNLISYFFKNKLEKEEYLSFLKTLIIYSKDNLVFIDYLEEINDDINMISTNNVLARNVVDKWILKIINNAK